MRGPSSSHSAAALRIGRLALALCGGRLSQVQVAYDHNGSLVTTHDGQGSDMGLYGGLLGWEADDKRLMNYKQELSDANISCETVYADYNARHPNTYKLKLWDQESSKMELVAISTGGGMIEVEEVEGFPVCMHGDYHETLLFMADTVSALALRDRLDACPTEVAAEYVLVHDASLGSPEKPCYSTTSGPWKALLQIKTCRPYAPSAVSWLRAQAGAMEVRCLPAVVPILSRKDIQVPFRTAKELDALLPPIRNLEHVGDAGEQTPTADLSAFAMRYEAARGGVSEAEVMNRMLQVQAVMRAAIDNGIAGTQYKDRILPCQAPALLAEMNKGMLIGGDVVGNIILYVTAIMESKSSMAAIVAAPTAGSCGACAGAVLAVADQLEMGPKESARALLISGLMGVFIQERATFSAEVGGCMAETGAGAGMAAAAIVYLGGGTAQQSLSACSMALQNSFGLACDPVANRVEAPCLGKNVNAATNALSCANMALAGYTHLIPLDEVLSAMDAVGRQIPHELRCTGKGGLAITPTALAIERRLNGGEAATDRCKVPC